MKDGGPAFPQHYEYRNGRAGSEGMSLRDYFAAAALGPTSPTDVQKAANWAYALADAMLIERDKA